MKNSSIIPDISDIRTIISYFYDNFASLFWVNFDRIEIVCSRGDTAFDDDGIVRYDCCHRDVCDG